MTIKRAFAQWMEDNGFGTFGDNLFIGTVPFEKKKDAAWWILGGGGAPTVRAQTGEKMKQYIITVFYRNTDAEDVDQKLQNFEETVNNKECHSLTGYETIDMEGTGFQSDQDLDGEDRTVGSVEVTVTVYQSQ